MLPTHVSSVVGYIHLLLFKLERFCVQLALSPCAFVVFLQARQLPPTTRYVRLSVCRVKAVYIFG